MSNLPFIFILAHRIKGNYVCFCNNTYSKKYEIDVVK